MTITAEDQSLTIHDIKKKIAKIEGISPSCQALIFSGKSLKDTSTLFESQIQNESILHLYFKNKGEVFILPYIKRKLVGKISKSPHYFKKLRVGVNFKADCIYCGESSLINIGFNKQKNEFFDIQKLSNQQVCPFCENNFLSKNIKNVYFVRCAWKIFSQMNKGFQSEICVGYADEKVDFVYLSEGEKDLGMYSFFYIRVEKWVDAYTYYRVKLFNDFL